MQPGYYLINDQLQILHKGPTGYIWLDPEEREMATRFERLGDVMAEQAKLQDMDKNLRIGIWYLR